PAVNPLDAWSRGGETASEIMSNALSIMMQDEDAAIGAVVHDRGPGGALYPSYLGYMRAAKEASGKPVALVAARQGSGCDTQAIEWTHAGYPVLDGVAVFLSGVRALFACRDHIMRPDMQAPDAPVGAIKQWRPRLAAAATLDEVSSLSMLQDFGIPVNRCHLAEDAKDIESAARAMNFPVVLKTAIPGIMHKTERQGVILGIATLEELRAAYEELAARLGPRAIVAPMVEQGMEMILGARHDPQFGAVVLLGFGGIHAEVQKDVVFALPPFDSAAALRYTNRLRMRPLLDGKRGAAPYDVEG